MRDQLVKVLLDQRVVVLQRVVGDELNEGSLVI